MGIQFYRKGFNFPFVSILTSEINTRQRPPAMSHNWHNTVRLVHELYIGIEMSFVVRYPPVVISFMSTTVVGGGDAIDTLEC